MLESGVKTAPTRKKCQRQINKCLLLGQLNVPDTSLMLSGYILFLLNLQGNKEIHRRKHLADLVAILIVLQLTTWGVTVEKAYWLFDI